MKQKFVLFAIAVMLSSGIMAQRLVSSKIIHLPTFEELVVSGPITVELMESANGVPEVGADDQFMNMISITLSNNSLHITFSGQEVENPVIRVSVKNLRSIVAEDGAKVITVMPLSSEEIMLTVYEESAAKIQTYGRVKVANPGTVEVRRPLNKG